MGRRAVFRAASWLGVGLFLGATCFLPAADHDQPLNSLDRADIGFIRHGLRPARSKAPDKKVCSEVYPVPEAAKHWSQCEGGEYSECGGPDQCACKVDERLIWYHCKEGSYAVCEDDNTCVDGS
jgi:hypothetical protein